MKPYSFSRSSKTQTIPLRLYWKKYRDYKVYKNKNKTKKLDTELNATITMGMRHFLCSSFMRWNTRCLSCRKSLYIYIYSQYSKRTITTKMRPKDDDTFVQLQYTISTIAYIPLSLFVCAPHPKCNNPLTGQCRIIEELKLQAVISSSSSQRYYYSAAHSAASYLNGESDRRHTKMRHKIAFHPDFEQCNMENYNFNIPYIILFILVFLLKTKLYPQILFHHQKFSSWLISYNPPLKRLAYTDNETLCIS